MKSKIRKLSLLVLTLLIIMTYGATVVPHLCESSKDAHIIDVIRNLAQK